MILLTGASTGIGAATTLRLARCGYHVFAGVRKPEAGRKLISEAGDAVTPIILDVTNAEHIRDAVAIVSEATGDRGLKAIVNNAGVAIAGPLEFLPIEELRRQMDINFIGQIAVTQAFLPLLRRARSVPDADPRIGRIVFMSSVSGRSSLPLVGAYGASKFALEAAADALRVELKRWGMSVVLIEPGVIATPIWDTARHAAEANIERMPPEVVTYYGKALDALRERAARGISGLPAERVAAVVQRALEARHPKPRYVIGRSARLRIMLETLLPDRVRDRVILEVTRRM